MPRPMKVIAQKDENGRLNWIEVYPRGSKKPLRLDYIWDADGLTREIEFSGRRRDMLSLAQVVLMFNEKFMERIGLVKLVKVIEKIETIEKLELVDLITKISEVTTVKTILQVAQMTTLMNVKNVESIDLIDQITNITQVSVIDNIKNIDKAMMYLRNAPNILNAGFEVYKTYTDAPPWVLVNSSITSGAFTGLFCLGLPTVASSSCEQLLEIPVDLSYVTDLNFMLYSDVDDYFPEECRVRCTVTYTDGSTPATHDFDGTLMTWVNCDMLPYVNTAKKIRAIKVANISNASGHKVACKLDDFILLSSQPFTLAASDITLDIHETGTANVAITSSVQLDINIAASAITLNVQTAVGEHIDVDITSSIQLNINLAASDITLNIHETGTANVAVISSVQLDINLAASAITVNVHETGTANVNIASSITLNMSITGSTIDVPITNPAGENLNVNIASSITVNMSITGATVNVPIETAEGKKVDVNIISTITLNVNLHAQTANINVDIKAQTVDLNIKTSGGANIIIDKLTVPAYTEDRRTIENNGATPLWTNRTGNNRFSKFFTRGCMGFINTIDVYCKNDGAAGTITVYISSNPSLGYVAKADVTVPYDLTGQWRSATFNRMWLSEKLFIFVVASHADIDWAYDAGTAETRDGFSSTDAGATWTHEDHRMWFRAVMKGQSVVILPIGGTVNNIEIPHSGAYSDSGEIGVAEGSETTLATIHGSGYMMYARFKCSAANLCHNDILRIYADGNVAFEESHFTINDDGYTPDSPNIQCLVYAANNVCKSATDLHIEYQRELKITVEGGAGMAAHTGLVRVKVNKTK